MYRAFIKEAEAEEHKAALVSFRNANAVEKRTTISTAMRWPRWSPGGTWPPAAIYVCEVCGHTHVGGAPDKCPVCGAAKSKFTEVN